MATIIRIAPNNQYGAQVASAAAQLRAAFGTLQELNGLRAEAIGAGQTEMQALFGTADNASAQMLNDRWQSLLDTVFNPASDQFAALGYLRDFMYDIVLDV